MSNSSDNSMTSVDQPDLTETADQQFATGDATRQPYPEEGSVAELVAAQAGAAPNSLAVSAGGETVTYRELDMRSNQLARDLRLLGVGTDVVVGLCLRRSIAMVVGALAILKAGGAYLPLDPTFPIARLRFQLEDARVPVLITGDCMTGRLPTGTWRLITLDPQGRQTDSHFDADGSEAPTIEMRGADLAYVIYTSGSTGQPKGVELTHSGLKNLVIWHRQNFAVTPRDRAVQAASPGFDAAVWEIWPYLTAGASLHVPDDDTRTDPERFRDWLVENAITIAFTPTPVAEQLIQLEWPSDTPLRVLLTGADTLRHHPRPGLPLLLVNKYGATECTVVTTSGLVPADLTPDGLPSIGRPITNIQFYIVDKDFRQLPPGIPGELYIGGIGLARGYRNRPNLNTERFIPNPFSDQLGSRLYRTGDLACYLPDGQIAFLGRNDDQIKIRGNRIEPDEVIAVLDRYPKIQASFVVAREDTPGEKQLVAYVVPADGQELTARVLREFLLLHLPKYMVPAIFCRLETLPLTPSGKVDRKALPAPTQAHVLSDDGYIAPRTPIEERITAMLASLLHLPRVGVNDNFFLLGGNSLLGAQVIARVRDTFVVELSLLTLFNHPTVAELAAETEKLLIAKLEAMSEDEALRLAALPFQESAL
jgi:amino acid adenylation domain-containing protein